MKITLHSLNNMKYGNPGERQMHIKNLKNKASDCTNIQRPLQSLFLLYGFALFNSLRAKFLFN